MLKQLWQHLRAGSHVLLEKPVSPTTDLIPALLRAERESAGRVLVGYQFRYHPGLTAVQDLLNDQDDRDACECERTLG